MSEAIRWPEIRAGHGAVASPHALASDAGLAILRGGGNALDAQGANEVIGQIEPRIVIPMHYRTSSGDPGLNDLAQFCKALGVEAPVPQDKVNIRKSDLPETVKVVILEP